jgi:diguanylate cyclase (GGDEF)-like protein
MTLIFSFIVLLNVLSIYMNYQNFVTTSKESTLSTGNTVAETCALIIDGDNLETYEKTRQRDNSYYEVWNKLIDYRNTNDRIVKLMVCWFNYNGCNYVFDTDLSDDGALLGDKVHLDTSQKVYETELTDGEDIGYIQYEGELDMYRPIYSSYNICRGYVIVGLDTTKAEKEQEDYLYRQILSMTILTVLLSIFFVWRINRTIVRPINKLSHAAANYEQWANEMEGESPLALLRIKTGDEIENLYLAIKKMETDILNSSNSLAIATWNSYHDSMTQLYNKGYLKERMEYYESQETLAVVYFDIDNLKKMNDICGHESGDEVICKTADFVRRYQDEKQGEGFRMGGDEFMLVMEGKAEDEISNLEIKMKDDPATILSPDKEVHCRIAIGYAFARGNINFEELKKQADQNMYKDKQSHR